MRIGIDARLASYRRGLGNYVFHLVSELRRIETAHRFVVYVDSAMAPQELAQWRSEQIELRVSRPYNYAVWEQLILPGRARRDGLDLLHCPAGTAPLGLSRQVKLCLTIPDVMSLLPDRILPSSPSAYQRMGRLYRRVVVPRAARRADGLATISEYSRRDIQHHLRIAPERVRVIHLAPNAVCGPRPAGQARDHVRAAYGIAGAFLLAMGGVDPRKNTSALLTAFASAKRRAGLPHALVLVGIPRTGQSRFLMLAAQLGVDRDVVLTDFISTEGLVALYNSAAAFVYPSLYEGFGLPVLEAMACGLPVIASSTTSIPEIAGDAALLIDPGDTGALSSAMIRLLDDAALRRTLIERGLARCREFSWEKTARQTLNLYADALAPRPPTAL